MARRNAKLDENVHGVFYVDDQCIYCGLCVEVAPGCFKQHPITENAFVYRQPTTAEELEACRKAAEGCPYDAIGDDGDEVRTNGAAAFDDCQ